MRRIAAVWLVPCGMALWLGAAGAAAQSETRSAVQPAVWSVGEARSFRDWIAACDNARACAAYGLQADGGGGAYVVLRRGAEAGAAATVGLRAMAPEAATAPMLRVEAAGGPGFGPKDYPADVAGPYLAVEVPAEDAPALVAALIGGTALRLASVEAGVAGETQAVSLAGSAAALLDLDDRQGRVGTVTALVRPGAAPASAVPAPPSLPVVARLPMAAIDPPPALPDGVAPSGEPSCAPVAPLAFDLGGGVTLWGVCGYAAAYNTSFGFTILDADGARPADFEIPGRPPDMPESLTGPSLAVDGLTLHALDLGRGLGDCGLSARWGWDGRGFGLVALSGIETCAGVLPEDWPVLWRSEPPS